MSVIKRCEIKRHEPYTGETCPSCNQNEQNAAVFGLVMAVAMFVGGIAAMVLVLSRLK